MKKYSLSHFSFDCLARNKEFRTNTARYIYVKEGWDYFGQYIIAKREPLGSDDWEMLGETVKVVIRYD